MTQPLHQLLDRVVLALDFETVESSGGVKYLLDRGPNGFHFRFAAGGAAPVEQLDGSYLFNGAQYLYYDGDLARFYAAMPTGEHTWIGAYQPTADADIALFSCWDSGAGGHNDGVIVGRGAASDQILAHQFQHDATSPNVASAANATPIARRVGFCVSVQAVPVSTVDGQRNAATWAAGAFGTTVFDPAIVPTIGAQPMLANYWQGPIGALGLFPWAFTDAEAKYMTDLLTAGAV